MAAPSQVMKAKLTVRYKSGREEQFEMELLGDSGTRARLKEFIQSPNLALQVDDQLVVIPATAIECVSLTLPREKDWTKELSFIRRAKRVRKK